MPKSTIKEAIVAALKKEGHPMSIQEIYGRIVEWDYYRFKAERPVNVVATEVRRHCKGVAFPSVHRDKYYQLLTDGTYWLIDAPIPSSVAQANIVEIPVLSKDTHTTSSENLKKQHHEFLSEFKTTVLNQLKGIDPQTFESFSRKLLEVYGFKDLVVTPYSKDGGIDGHGKLKVGITYLDVAFQCKRWKSTTVPKKEIQSFRGDIQGKFEQGIYFTTSSYSKDAQKVSIQKGAVPIILIDGGLIVDIMIERKFGVEVEQLPIYINALDRALTEDL